VPKLNLPPAVYTHSENHTIKQNTTEEEDELQQVSFDSFYCNVEQNGGPTTSVAARAVNARHLTLETNGLRTPRRYKENEIVDFIATESQVAQTQFRA